MGLTRKISYDAASGEVAMSEHNSAPLADKINYLFATVRPRQPSGRAGREYSNEHVASEIGRISGVTISQSYIWQLRKGKKNNPTMRHLQALADFFGVPAAYFFDGEVADRVTAALGTLAEERTRREMNGPCNEVALMAMRAGELSPERRQQVMDLLDLVYRLEQAERRAQGGGRQPGGSADEGPHYRHRGVTRS
jgi:transcriptional regulator with XRE-family HTH domain